MRDPSTVRVVALCSCILGAFFLAKSISTRSPKYVLHELLRFKVNRIKFVRKYVTQKLEVVVGFICLFAGFGLQIYLEIQALSRSPEPAHGLTDWGMIIGFTVLVTFLIAVLLNRICAFFSGKIFVELMRFMVDHHGFPLENDESLLLELGRVMKVKREESDTIESYSARIRARMGLAPEPQAPQERGELAY
ncbi:MAG: hypothetical protein ACE5JG_12165 [Planctomycetota bacterium]